MQEKDLRRLSRRELLEMLIAQIEENDNLRWELEQAQAQLNSKKIDIEKTGSIAEAALSLNKVFEDADKAAAQYLENIQRLCAEQEAISQNIEAATNEKCEHMIQESEARSKEIMEAADAYKKKTLAEIDQYRAHAKTEADAYWQEVSLKVDLLLKEHESLEKLLSNSKKD